MFERNEHGHVVLTLLGRDFGGETEIRWLEEKGFHVDENARWAFRSTGSGSYDECNRLENRIYRVALVPGSEIRSDAARTSHNLLRLGMGRRYRYGQPLAGLVPRVREVLSDEAMEALGFWNVLPLHDPIDCVGWKVRLRVSRDGDGRRVGVSCDFLDNRQSAEDAFAFPVF